MQSKYVRRGWYGDSSGHSMAAKGIRLYSQKQRLMDPVFAAKKREEQVSSSHISQMIKEGYSFQQIKSMHPEADSETVRLQGIKAIDARSGSNTMHMLNSNGVDMTVKLLKVNPGARQRALVALRDNQKSSFIPEIKVQLLKKRLGELEQ